MPAISPGIVRALPSRRFNSSIDQGAGESMARVPVREDERRSQILNCKARLRRPEPLPVTRFKDCERRPHGNGRVGVSLRENAFAMPTIPVSEMERNRTVARHHYYWRVGEFTMFASWQ